jgi:hypothetical protein
LHHDNVPSLAWLGVLRLFSVSSIEDKLKGRHFVTIEVTEADSQAVLNALTEHHFQDAFKKMAEELGTVRTRGRELLRG